MNTETVLHETIKPSTPTPDRLRSFKLSLLDQMTPPVYTPIIFFYSINNVEDHHPLKVLDLSAKLKDSLSKTLTLFYPFAGRIKENLYVDCNDEGISFMEARVNLHLSNFLENPNLELLDQLLPYQAAFPKDIELETQIAIKLNVFACGTGIAIGMCFLHKIIDGTTIGSFMKTWADFARGIPVDVETATEVAFSLFPPGKSLPTRSPLWLGSPFPKEGKSKARRFCFGAKEVSKLKEKACSETVREPTTVESVSGFIWKCAMNASKSAAEYKRHQPSVLTHAVNLRKRMDPTLPVFSIGNIVWKAFTTYSNTNDAETIELDKVVSLLRKSISGINSEYAGKLVGNESFDGVSKWLEDVDEMYSKGKPVEYMCTSWCQMGFSKVDFGWGKPVWVSPARVVNAVFKNIVILMESVTGDGQDGIEAWLILEENEMSAIEQDPEFLEFASLNPSVFLTYKPESLKSSKVVLSP